jgi:hypothetical protein
MEASILLILAEKNWSQCEREALIGWVFINRKAGDVNSSAEWAIDKEH